jgi:hypothetical protein
VNIHARLAVTRTLGRSHYRFCFAFNQAVEAGYPTGAKTARCRWSLSASQARAERSHRMRSTLALPEVRPPHARRAKIYGSGVIPQKRSRFLMSPDSITDRRLACRTPAHSCLHRSTRGHFIALLYPYIGLDKRLLPSLPTCDHHITIDSDSSP